MEKQSRYIAELRNEMYSYKSQSSAETMVTQKNLEKVEENFRRAIDQNYLKFENLLLNR